MYMYTGDYYIFSEYSSFDVCSDNEVAYQSRDSTQGHYQVRDLTPGG